MTMRFVSLCGILLAMFANHQVRAGSLTLEQGRPFTQADFATLVADTLPPARPGERLVLRALAPSLPMANNAPRSVRLELVDIRIDQAAGQFAADLTVQSEGGTRNPLKLRGSATDEVETLSLSTAMAAGEPIDAASIVLDWIPKARLPEGALRAPTDLAGMEAARRLQAGRPLREADIRPASLVRRNDVVDVVYHSATMEISLLGRALSDGSDNTLVRVLNADSGKELVARVIGQKKVEVTGAAR